MVLNTSRCATHTTARHREWREAPPRGQSVAPHDSWTLYVRYFVAPTTTRFPSAVHALRRPRTTVNIGYTLDRGHRNGQSRVETRFGTHSAADSSCLVYIEHLASLSSFAPPSLPATAAVRATDVMVLSADCRENIEKRRRKLNRRNRPVGVESVDASTLPPFDDRRRSAADSHASFRHCRRPYVAMRRYCCLQCRH